MSALGTPIDVDRTARLTRFQFYLGLADALACKKHTDSVHLKELANSFSHDVLNIAALAGRLLWYEGVTPEVWRSHDLIAVSVDAEAFYVMLQSACDIMADVIATLGAKKGQAPTDSFHKLNEWALANPRRLHPEYHLVAATLPWFREINSIRTGIVHRGKTILVYTDRVTFNWGRLVPSFRDLTHSMLSFSENLGAVVVDEGERKKTPRKVVIDGVYVPALHHLLNDYTVPKESEELKRAARSLLACGGYVEAAYIGYPNGFWWRLLISSSQKLLSDVVATDIRVSGGRVHDCKFVFSDGSKRFGLIACDHGRAEAAWLEGAARSARQLQAQFSTSVTVLVVRKMDGDGAGVLPDSTCPIIVGSDAEIVAEQVTAAIK